MTFLLTAAEGLGQKLFSQVLEISHLIDIWFENIRDSNYYCKN